MPENELPDDALAESGQGDPAPTPRKPRRLLWLWTLLALLVCVPIALTLIGAVTSPPHLKGIPSGHLVYLEAEAPSEHTTTLRGLYVTEPGTGTRLLVHETEPQDIDGGIREWITQPALSPDGSRVAFEKQFISLQEEKQSIENQIWVMPLAASSSQKPHMILSLTRQKLKQIVGIAWDSDSSLLLLEDTDAYSVSTDASDPPDKIEAPLKAPLDLQGLTLALTPDVSATCSPGVSETGGFSYNAHTPNGSQVLIHGQNGVTRGPSAALFALSPDGGTLALVPPGSNGVIRLYTLASNQYRPDLKARWGWSVFGKRQITSLRWSPDGSQIAYTVSKPPIPDDELFIINAATGKVFQLPYRAGRAAWDWGK